METDHIKIDTIIVSLMTVIVVEVIFKYIGSRGQFSFTLILMIARLLEIILLILSVYFCEKKVSSIGIDRATIIPGLKKGLLWAGSFGIITFICFVLIFIAGMNPLKFIYTDLPHSYRDILLFFLVGSLIGPIAEELFFRGILYSFFRRWGVIVATVITTVIFALAHPNFSGISFPKVAGGIVFAVSYEWEGNLMVPITIHVLGNTAIYLLSLMI